MMECPELKVSPWDLCCMFTSLSPAAIPLEESCTISRAKVGLANLTSPNPTLVINFSLANQNRRICYLLTPFVPILSCNHSHFNDVFSSERATTVQFWKSEALWFNHFKAQQKDKTRAKDFTFFISPLLCSYPNYSKIGTFLSGFPSSFHTHIPRWEMLLFPALAVPQWITWVKENGYLSPTLCGRFTINNVKPAHFHFPGRICHILSDLAAMRSVWHWCTGVCNTDLLQEGKKRKNGHLPQVSMLEVLAELNSIYSLHSPLLPQEHLLWKAFKVFLPS